MGVSICSFINDQSNVSPVPPYCLLEKVSNKNPATLYWSMTDKLASFFMRIALKTGTSN